MKKLIKFTSVVLSLIFCAVFVLIGIGDVYIPDEITVYDNSEIRLLKVFSVETGERAVTTAAARGTPAVKGSVKLFGIFPAGEIDTVEKQRKYVNIDMFRAKCYSKNKESSIAKEAAHEIRETVFAGENRRRDHEAERREAAGVPQSLRR